jgi:hypothetical protein
MDFNFQLIHLPENFRKWARIKKIKGREENETKIMKFLLRIFWRHLLIKINYTNEQKCLGSKGTNVTLENTTFDENTFLTRTLCMYISPDRPTHLCVLLNLKNPNPQSFGFFWRRSVSASNTL